MNTNCNAHITFLEQELQVQVKSFEETLNTSASRLLLVENQMYVAKYIKFRNDGEMLLKMSNKHKLPRKNDYLYAFTVPDSYRSYKNWGELTYGELIKFKTAFSEVHCVWYSNSEDENFSLVGMRGVTEEFKKYVESVPGCIIILGPQVPPFEYLINLQKIIKAGGFIDTPSNSKNDELTLIGDNGFDIIKESIQNNRVTILQGPPGTGKTYLIAQLCEYFCNLGKSVLVTALTNRALMEVASKSMLKELLSKGRIGKTNLTSDEKSELYDLSPIKKLDPVKGFIKLSTYYLTSGYSKDCTSNYSSKYDIVIMDEASQAFMGMFVAADHIGKKHLWVGDTNQMPPIVLLNDDHITRHGYRPFVDGMSEIVASKRFPTFQLTYTYRLTPSSTNLTSLFYNGTLKSKNEGIDMEPLLVNMTLESGNDSPHNGIYLTSKLAEELSTCNPKSTIAVLSHKIESVKSLQKMLSKNSVSDKNVIVETVARVQGLTVDYTIYFIPKTDCMIYSLEKRLFNVATSRARQRTIIVADSNILDYKYKSSIVESYLRQMKQILIDNSNYNNTTYIRNLIF